MFDTLIELAATACGSAELLSTLDLTGAPPVDIELMANGEQRRPIERRHARGLIKRKVKFIPAGHRGTGATRYRGNHARRPPVVLASLRATQEVIECRNRRPRCAV